MTSREGPCSSEQTGVFISWSRIRYLLSIWHNLASRLEYWREQGGHLRPDQEAGWATPGCPQQQGRGAGDRMEGRRRVCASGYLSPRQQAAPGPFFRGTGLEQGPAVRALTPLPHQSRTAEGSGRNLWRSLRSRCHRAHGP